ncbi:NADH dehydrogenase [ubiquinone] 1 beta subcomplex subunit 8, mitochondrial-like [Tubulanus polymorphus]|uniref:NADH dehydrogenase [ubiquinone] 1 beta subcomplex subunit 8, mitochondrial-like n=1 Tax=Tubulanus polymorphus TaxID=672921 RepID=UPI003DA3959B
MASVFRILRRSHKKCLPLASLLARNGYLATPLRQASYWNQDWRATPGEPKTPEEKSAAAKKYGMLPEDYEPYPDDGTGFGDYPKLPYVGGDIRSPNDDWDMPEMKRNFMEPLNLHQDIIGEDRWNPNHDQMYKYSLNVMMSFFVILIATSAGLYYLGDLYPTYFPGMPKQYPYEYEWNPKAKPTTHYTFEPLD